MGPPRRLCIELDEVRGVPILEVSGEVDLATVGDLSVGLDRAMERMTGAGRVVVDLRDLRFIEVTGIRALIGGDLEARTLGGELRVVDEQGPAQRILDLWGLERGLAVYSDLAAAVYDESLRGASAEPGRGLPRTERRGQSRGTRRDLMQLPPGYRVERDPDVWTLYAPDGHPVARFIAGVPEERIEAAARADHEGPRAPGSGTR